MTSTFLTPPVNSIALGVETDLLARAQIPDSLIHCQSFYIKILEQFNQTGVIIPHLLDAETRLKEHKQTCRFFPSHRESKALRYYQLNPDLLSFS